MSNKISLFIFLSLVCFGIVFEQQKNVFYDKLVIQDVQRSIDASTHIARHTIRLSVYNKGEESANDFILAVPNFQVQDLSYVTAEQNNVKLSVIPLPDSIDKDCKQFQVTFTEPLMKDKSAKILVKMAFGNQYVAFPKEIRQNDIQKVIFRDNVFYYSVYRVSGQLTTIYLGNSNIETYSQYIPTSQKGDTLTYGPYSAQSPRQYVELRVHFQNTKKLLTINKLTRLLEISHWGNLAVEEHYDLKNSGPALKDNSFSRLDYQRSGNNAPTVISHLIAKLPIDAHDIYYRDRIGNISTSTCRPSHHDKNYLEFDFQPRFPLFGNWKTEFYIGYNIPLVNVLSLSPGGHSYRFQYNFGTPLENTIITSYTLKIIFPEGADNIKQSFPFPLDTVEWETMKTYLDTKGRKVLVVTKRNVVDEESTRQFQVDYTYTWLDLLRKPFVVMGALFSFCVLFMVFVRMDLTIAKGKHTQEQEQEIRVLEAVESYLAQHHRRDELLDSLQGLVNNPDNEQVQAVEKQRQVIQKEIDQILLEVKEAQTGLMGKIGLLENKDKMRFDLVKRMNSIAAQTGKSEKEREKQLEAVMEEYDRLTAEINDILSELQH